MENINSRLYITQLGASENREDNAPFIEEGIGRLEKGGTLVIPAGVFITGAFSLKSDITLELEAGAVLKAHSDIQRYVENRFVDSFGKYTTSLITAYGCRNITFKGEGTIDLSGSGFMNFDFREKDQNLPDSYYEEAEAKPLDRPRRPILFADCENIRIENILLKDAPCWTVTFHHCTRVAVESVTIRNHPRIPHNDGLHFTACSQVTVHGCDMICGDDCIAVTSLFDYALPTRGVLISDCHLCSRSAAVRIGHLKSRVSDVIIHHIITHDTNRGIAVFAGDEGLVENVLVSDCILHTRLYNGSWWGRGEPLVVCAGHSNGVIRHVTFKNIMAFSENPAVIAGEYVSDISFKECHIEPDYTKDTREYFELYPNGLEKKPESQTEIVNLTPNPVKITD